MCTDCASEYSADDLPGNADEVLASIAAIYAHPAGGSGGPLHVVLDDFNVEDSQVSWCIGHMGLRPDWYPDGLLELGQACAALLEPLTPAQRGAVVSRHWGYL